MERRSGPGSRAWDTEAHQPEQADFGTEVPANPDIIFDYEEELQAVNDENSVIASIRSWEEYLGNISGYTYIGEAGDIAGSRFGYAGSDPYSMEDFRNVDNTMFNYEMMEDRWERWGNYAGIRRWYSTAEQAGVQVRRIFMACAMLGGYPYV